MAATYEASLVAVTMQQTAAPVLAELCPLKWTGLTIADELGSPGTCELEMQVESLAAETAAKARLINLAAAPCELWVRRSNAGISAFVFAGPIIGCKILDRTLTISAGGLLAYIQYMLREADYAASSVDQATIVQQLLDQQQALDYGHRGLVTTGLTATGVTRDLNLPKTEGKWLLPVITEMGSRSNGFDLTVDPVTRALRMWSPRKGNDLTAGVFLDRRSIGIPSTAWSVTPGLVGSEVFASSSSTGGATLSALKSNPTLRATFGRTYVARSYQDISVQATLDEHAVRAVDDVGSR